MRALRRGGFDGASGLAVPQPLGYFPRVQLVMMEKAGGSLLRQRIYSPCTDWPAVMVTSLAGLVIVPVGGLSPGAGVSWTNCATEGTPEEFRMKSM